MQSKIAVAVLLRSGKTGQTILAFVLLVNFWIGDPPKATEDRPLYNYVSATEFFLKRTQRNLAHHVFIICTLELFWDFFAIKECSVQFQSGWVIVAERLQTAGLESIVLQNTHNVLLEKAMICNFFALPQNMFSCQTLRWWAAKSQENFAECGKNPEFSNDISLQGFLAHQSRLKLSAHPPLFFRARMHLLSKPFHVVVNVYAHLRFHSRER